MSLGATLDEWLQFDFTLGLGKNLLPCVPASPDVKVQAGSQLEGKVGKIPSMFNGRGEAHGLTGWQKREIADSEVAYWSKDRRLNLCVRTGPVSGIYAFDIDIDDERAEDANKIIQSTLPNFPTRTRPNSRKRLLMFRMEEPCKKRKIKLDDNPRGPAIELLADGQQFVACGTHSSGVRYHWAVELPSSIPTITLAQLDSIWTILTSKYAKTPSTTVTSTAPAATATTGQTELMKAISEEDWQLLLSSLRFMLDKVSDNDTWSEVGYALLSLQLSRPARQLWLDFSAKAKGYEPGAAEQWWLAHHSQVPRTDYRHIFNMARQRGMLRVASPDDFPPVPEQSSPQPANSDLVDVVPPEVQPTSAPRMIRLSEARFSEILDELEEVLNPFVYTQGTSLVRTSEAHNDGAIRRNADALMLISATKEWARKRFGQLCDFKKYLSTKGEWVSVAPSVEHINTMLGLGSWNTLRPLDAIARSPFLRDDFSICDVPGYDKSSRALYVPSTTYPPIPENPTRDDALAALARLREPFNEFPWKEAASESAFISHILAEAARLAMDHCPMYVYDAPAFGTGKSTLQEMAARVAHGTEPAMRPWVTDEDEIRKSIYACLMAGDRSIWFDNVPDGIKVRSSVLEAFLTSSVWKDRKLGESVTSAIPNKTVLVASGNNVTIVGGLARRSLVVRLDANTENLRDRIFRIESPKKYVMKHRAQLLVDALTIIKAYLLVRVDLSTRPKAPITLPSFEEWSRLARDPLIWLGMADPVVTQLNETDDETRNIGPIFEKLAANFGERPFTAADMARAVGSLLDQNNELSDLLMQMGCAEPSNPIKVGYWLRASKDKIGSGWKLLHEGHNNRGVKWKLQKINGDLTNG
jgi:Primase C terminal 2 (PriCT-2)